MTERSISCLIPQFYWLSQTERTIISRDHPSPRRYSNNFTEASPNQRSFADDLSARKGNELHINYTKLGDNMSANYALQEILKLLKPKCCRLLGKVTPSKLWSKPLPKVKLRRLLGKSTPSKLWLNFSAKVKVCRLLGQMTPSKLWLK